MKRFNWQILLGFVLSIVAFLSFFLFFVQWPLTRDFPWVNLLLFALAAVLIFFGIKHAWQKRLPSKIIASVLTALSILILGTFVFFVFVFARWLPASTSAPAVSQQAPDFSLQDQNGKPTTLAELSSTPINGKAPKGVLLIFYRGYW